VIRLVDHRDCGNGTTEALPNARRQQYRNRPGAGILLARTEHLKLLQPAFFFFVATPPQRLSYTRVQVMVRMLATTLIRQE
jgi:hypothetical protein